MNTTRTDRGFTLIEMAVVMAIVVVLASMAMVSYWRFRPRANLTSIAAELQSTIHGARSQALATGHDVWLVVFPQFANGVGTGRVVVYEDGSFTFNAGGSPNLGTYDPAAASSSQVVATVDLPVGIVVGPATGMGSSAALPAPLDGVDVTKACSFCSTSGDQRGAVRFDPEGRVTFYSGTALQNVVGGASLTLNAAEVGGTRTLVITSAAGAVQMLVGG
jgi:prepilin-type N-terminal cleavage/methylation domain-containing protein